MPEMPSKAVQVVATPEICLNLPPSAMVGCSASSEYSSGWACGLAFDGNTGTGWATWRQGVGSWIKANFDKPYIIKELKIMQRANYYENNKDIGVEFDFGQKRSFTLPITGSGSFNKLVVNPPVLSRTLKITVNSVYATINNGFREITIFGCTGGPFWKFY